jgi:hypothetical protein
MLGKLLQFARRRTKSRCADDKAVDDFASVAKDRDCRSTMTSTSGWLSCSAAMTTRTGIWPRSPSYWGRVGPRIPLGRS